MIFGGRMMNKLRQKEINITGVVSNAKGTIIWGGLLLVWILVLSIPYSRTAFISFTEIHPYLGGFFKFAILASMGDVLGARILSGKWQMPQGFIYKALVWGVLGMIITLVFTVFMAGAAGAQASGRLPFPDSTVAHAFFGSMIMNLTFGPMMYVYHKFADLFIDMKIEKKVGKLKSVITLKAMVERIDWFGLVSFSWLTTCIFVWIPLHTVVFLLPAEYRVLASAFLSILLGALIALSKKGANKSVLV